MSELAILLLDKLWVVITAVYMIDRNQQRKRIKDLENSQTNSQLDVHGLGIKMDSMKELFSNEINHISESMGEIKQLLIKDREK